MSYRPIDSMDKTNLILDLLSKNQQTISANITNVNTPGYVRQNYDFKQYLANTDGPLETDMSQRLGPSPFIMQTGGKVNVGQELIEMQKNNLFYNISVRRMNSTIQEIKTVINVGK